MVSPDDCSKEVLDTIPLLMQAIRTEVRSQRKSDLSVPQFRVLAFLYRNPGASLSQAAEHVGLTLPSMSKIVDGLVERGYVRRETCPDDRRRVDLGLTSTGKSVLAVARDAAQERLSVMLAPLSVSDRTAVVSAMRALRNVFAGDRSRRGQ